VKTQNRDISTDITVQGKANPLQAWIGPEDDAPILQGNWHMKVVRLSVLHTGHLYPPGNIPGTHFF